MFFFIILQIINVIKIFECKNVVLPFKKITIESFKNEKTIKDFISYNIYTTIEIGIEPQSVGFFLDQTEATFSVQKRLISFNSSKLKEVMKLYHNISNFWLDIHKSKEISNCYFQQICSELFHFDTFSNSKVEANKFKFNIYSEFLNEKYKCGIIGLRNPSNVYYENNETIFFFDELKSHNLIDEKIFTILYNEKKDIFNSNEDLFQGKIIIGEYPHKFDPTKFTSTDEIIMKGAAYLTEEIVLPGNGYVFLVNELKFNSSNKIYLESDVHVQISFTSGFIKGTNLYRKEIHKVFFEDLIKKQLCKIEYLEENVYTNEYFIYSCNSDQEILEKIKTFPPLYFEIKTQNLQFIFTYENLFKQFNDRIYFLIAFRDEKYYVYSSKCYFGEIFLRKYITSFDYDSKSIIFYRNQVNDANLNSKTIYEKKEKEKQSNIFGVLRILLEIFMGIFIIFMIYIFYRKIRSKRKLHANELEDNNFVYESKKEKNYVLFENEQNGKKEVNI